MRLDRVLMVPPGLIETAESRQYLPYEGENLGLVSAAQPLDLAIEDQKGEKLTVLVISDRLNRYGIVVDRLLGEVELVVQPLDPRLGKVPNISAAAVLEDGAPVLIIDVEDLVRSIDNMLKGGEAGQDERADSVRAEPGEARAGLDDSSPWRS